jgi:hydrogenase maturation protease
VLRTVIVPSVAPGGGSSRRVGRAPTRVLGLGNEILADDAFGILVAQRIRDVAARGEVEVAVSSEAGFRLLDAILDCSRLVVVDTVETGRAAPGTIYVTDERDLPAARAQCPHGLGLFDALALGRQLDLPVPEQVTIVAVEAADCLTVGGSMHPAVIAAVARVAELILNVYAFHARPDAA